MRRVRLACPLSEMRITKITQGILEKCIKVVNLYVIITRQPVNGAWKSGKKRGRLQENRKCLYG